MPRIVTVTQSSAGAGTPSTVDIEVAMLSNHPTKFVARIRGVGNYKGPWDSEATAIRSICQIYSIGGP